MEDFRKGQLLISEPYLGDENFERTVVLLCEHNDQGTVGFILNKPTSLTLEDVMEDMIGCEHALYVGGPVEQNSLHFIYRHNTPEFEHSVEIQKNVYWGGDFDSLKEHIENDTIKKEDIRFFLGYSGWSAGQLKEEFQKNSWFIAELDCSDLFDTTPDELWRAVLKKMGGKYKMYANYPIDPRLN